MISRTTISKVAGIKSPFIPHSPAGAPYSLMDETLVYKRRGAGGDISDQSLPYDKYSALRDSKKSFYEGVRARIKHPDIQGPFDTGWGMTNFDAQLSKTRLGLPALPGQTTSH